MTTGLQKAAQENLRRLVEQIERLQTEQAELGVDIKEKFSEARNVGFDVKVLRKIIRDRKKSKSEREDEESIYQIYAAALGMEGTPMGDWLESNNAQAELVG